VPTFSNFKLATLTIRSRAMLIACTVALQALVMGLGVFFTHQLTSSGVRGRLQESLTSDHSKVVDHYANELHHVSPKPLCSGSDDWAVAQELIESTQLPRGGQLMLLDREGKVLCHTEFSHNPNITRSDYAEQKINLIPGGELWQLGNINPGATLTAEALTPSGPAIVSFRYDAQREIKIVLIQPQSALAAAGARITDGLWTVVLIGGALVLAIGAAGSFTLVRRYDSVLSRANRALEAEVARRTKSAVNIRDGLIFGLAKLADFRDTDTGRHLERICRYSELLAEELKSSFAEITPEWIELLRLASSMHDIGKVGVADSVLLKPGPLSETERRHMQMHTVIGADTLSAIQRRVGEDPLLDMSIRVSLEHHEKFDGTGYPYGLKGTEISLAARIVALADVYDALTSHRVYKAAMTHDEASEIIIKGRGSHFDPEIVDAFLRVRHEFERTRLKLSPSIDLRSLPKLAA
jgi:HD-GYP domain-containing protein (c-di-GMP phosphodiesterase class II)